MANDQAIEQLKRQLYFDNKRDEFMAMNEYLVSPISDLDLRNSGKAGGGMASLNYLLRPISMAAGGPIPPEPEKTGMMKKVKDLFKYENKSGTGSLLMDFISNKGMFAPSGKKFDTSDSPMFEDAKPIGLLDDAMDVETLGMILELQGVLSFDEIDKMKNMSPIQIKILYDKTFSGKKGA